MNASERPEYCAIRLNLFTDASWAVICNASGAIALDAEGRLMTKMTERQAQEAAARMSERPKSSGAPSPG